MVGVEVTSKTCRSVSVLVCLHEFNIGLPSTVKSGTLLALDSVGVRPNLVSAEASLLFSREYWNEPHLRPLVSNTLQLKFTGSMTRNQVSGRHLD